MSGGGDVATSTRRTYRGHTDGDVARYYADRTRAAGLARLYEADTALGEFYRDRVRRVAGMLEGESGNLVDVGCGTGQIIRHLRGSSPGRFELTGVDRSEAMIDEARAVVGGDSAVRLVTGRIESLPLESATYDVVLAMGVLEYVEDIARALDEMARIVRPDGLVVLTMQNRWSPYRLWESNVWARVQQHRGETNTPILHRLGERQLRQLLRRSGFDHVRMVRFGFNLFLSPLDYRFPKAATALGRRLDTAVPGPLRRLASDYAVTARRARIRL